MRRTIAVAFVATALFASAPAAGQVDEHPTCDEALQLPTPEILPAGDLRHVLPSRMAELGIVAIVEDQDIDGPRLEYLDMRVYRPGRRAPIYRRDAGLVTVNPAVRLGDYEVISQAAWVNEDGYVCVTVRESVLVVAPNEVGTSKIRSYASRAVSRIRGAFDRERPDLVQRWIDDAQADMVDLRADSRRVEAQWSAWRRQLGRFERAFVTWDRFRTRYAEGRMVVEARRLRDLTTRIGVR